MGGRTRSICRTNDRVRARIGGVGFWPGSRARCLARLDERDRYWVLLPKQKDRSYDDQENSRGVTVIKETKPSKGEET